MINYLFAHFTESWSWLTILQFWRKYLRKLHNCKILHLFRNNFCTLKTMIPSRDGNSQTNTKNCMCGFCEPFLVCSFRPRGISFKDTSQAWSNTGHFVQSVEVPDRGHPYCQQMHGVTSYGQFICFGSFGWIGRLKTKGGWIPPPPVLFKLDWEPGPFRVKNPLAKCLVHKQTLNN